MTDEQIEKESQKYANQNFIEAVVREHPWPAAKAAYARAYADGARFALDIADTLIAESELSMQSLCSAKKGGDDDCKRASPQTDGDKYFDSSSLFPNEP